MQKQLENARASYTSLQRQYLEQCSSAEKYRSALRQRDEDLKAYQEQSSLHDAEEKKWVSARDTYEERMSQLEVELAVANHAQSALEEQKQENMLLKETIDRMRFEMDEMRSSFQSEAGKDEKGNKSQPNTIGKSLGAEMTRADSRWIDGSEWERVGDSEGNEDTSAETDAHSNSGETTIVHEEAEERFEVGSDGEDVIQTIITRKTRASYISRYLACIIVNLFLYRKFPVVLINHERLRSPRPRNTQTRTSNTTRTISSSALECRLYPNLLS